MQRIAHIIHPVVVPPTSDLTIAQPITYRALLAAQQFARGKVDVRLLTTKYHDETPEIPDGFTALPDLIRSVQDVGRFEVPRKLALLGDILQRLYEGSQDADYLIYTNVDIAPVPYFYVTLAQMIDRGYDALITNRRAISDVYTSPDELPLMYADLGRAHEGFDCFVFRRDAYPKFRVGNICIGTGRVGLTLLLNLACHSRQFKECRDTHLTFHVGDMPAWMNPRLMDYLKHNQAQLDQVIAELEKAVGPLDQHPVASKYRAIIEYRPDGQSLLSRIQRKIRGKFS